MKYYVCAPFFYKVFNNEKSARDYFNEIKDDVSYCELKVSINNGKYLYNQSLAIAHK